MTDTTDIKALRGEVPGIPNLFDAGRLIAKLFDQLEAERQRADGYRDCIRVLADQLSVNALPKEVIEAVAALKGELANPVVLPERWKPCDCIDCAYAYDSEATKKAINEAGFTVKGE